MKSSLDFRELVGRQSLATAGVSFGVSLRTDEAVDVVVFGSILRVLSAALTRPQLCAIPTALLALRDRIEFLSKFIGWQSANVLTSSLLDVEAPVSRDASRYIFQLSLEVDEVDFPRHHFFGGRLALVKFDFEVDVNGLLLFFGFSLDFWRLHIHHFVQKLLITGILPHLYFEVGIGLSLLTIGNLVYLALLLESPAVTRST